IWNIGAGPRLRLTLRTTIGVPVTIAGNLRWTAAKLAMARSSEKLPATCTPQGAQGPFGMLATTAEPAPGLASAAATVRQERDGFAFGGAPPAIRLGSRRVNSSAGRPVMANT